MFSSFLRREDMEGFIWLGEGDYRLSKRLREAFVYAVRACGQRLLLLATSGWEMVVEENGSASCFKLWPSSNL